MSIKIDRLLLRAKKIIKKGQFDEAKKIYEDILESSPSNKEAKIGLLELNQNKETKPNKNQLEALVDLHKTGEFQKALFVIDDLIKTYDNDPFLFNIKGSCLCETGDLNASIISFERAIALKPDYAEALFNLGVAHQKLNQPEMAIESYEKALDIQHAYPTVHHNLGIIFYLKGQLNSAIKSFEWAVAYSPNHSKAYYNLGNKKIDQSKMDTDAGTGYFKANWSGKKIDVSMADVKVENPNSVVAWGALYWQYFEDLDKITSFEDTPLKLNKKLFKMVNSDQGPVMTELKEGSELSLGDKLQVRIELQVDRPMEYVHMKDMRASGFEPLNVLSQYKWQGGLGYYESTRDASTNFFISYLPKGTFVFEYAMVVNHKGDFSNGVTTIQCMYAPEFASHSEGARVKVQ